LLKNDVKLIQIEKQEEVKGIYGDLSRPGEPLVIGSRHPISIVKTK
jgi:phenylalanyl-tRNA synthetase alpha chain